MLLAVLLLPQDPVMARTVFFQVGRRLCARPAFASDLCLSGTKFVIMVPRVRRTVNNSNLVIAARKKTTALLEILSKEKIKA